MEPIRLVFRKGKKAGLAGAVPTRGKGVRAGEGGRGREREEEGGRGRKREKGEEGSTSRTRQRNTQRLLFEICLYFCFVLFFRYFQCYKENVRVYKKTLIYLPPRFPSKSIVQSSKLGN